MSAEAATEEALWNTEDCAQYLKLSEGTVRRLRAQGVIPSRKIGGTVRYVPAEIRAWVLNPD